MKFEQVITSRCLEVKHQQTENVDPYYPLFNGTVFNQI